MGEVDKEPTALLQFKSTEDFLLIKANSWITDNNWEKYYLHSIMSEFVLHQRKKAKGQLGTAVEAPWL